MTAEAQLAGSSALRGLQQAAEARGLKFYINPPREVVPTFLGDFQPDAIALGPEGGIVIEVKSQKSRPSERQLAAIAKRISEHKGWEFRAIYLSPRTEEAPPIAKPTLSQLQAVFGEIDALIKGGYSTAAFIVLWAALESLARLASSLGGSERPESLSPIQVVQTLAEEGYIENEAADRLREMTKLRNAIVHGDLSIDVPADQISSMLDQLRGIARNIAEVASSKSV